ncbi:MAG TPA: GNAT family N-acetyltransferase [Ktedonobacterales bacterium]|nr:GNAT family N-acetyltransferase [Ktedonobacterales bacterium]
MSESPVVVRQMKLDDLPQVFRIGNPHFGSGEELSYSYWSLDEIVDHFSNWGELCFVAESDGQVLGFVLGANEYNGQRMGHLEWIAVDHAYQQRGVATKLAETVFNAMREQHLPYAVIDVEESNHESMAFFGKRLGLKPVAAINFFKKPLP